MVEEKIKFFYPIKTLPVSLTGDICSLNCLHCNSFYLKGMKTKDESLSYLQSEEFSSFLISGGFDEKGKLDIFSNLDYIKKVKTSGKKIVLHPGFITKEEIDALKGYIDVISFDFIYDDETIKEIYHLEYKKEDFKTQYLLLRRNIKTIPHIIVGLYKGIIKGEYEAIDVLAELKPSLIIFLVIVPTKETPFEKINIPDIGEIKELFMKAKRKLRLTKFHLGCMVPKGEIKDEIELAAFESGFIGFVNPQNKLKNLVKDPEVYYECDALYY
ncbi:MAG: radical SAM protein [Caldisericia bacterium]|nr:radical SAM protein [Caldisericia bacterium]